MTLINSDNVTNLLQTYLHVQGRRVQIISSSIAAADTPRYVAKELDFEDFLKDAAAKMNLPRSKQAAESVSATSLQVIDQTPTKLVLTEIL